MNGGTIQKSTPALFGKETFAAQWVIHRPDNGLTALRQGNGHTKDGNSPRVIGCAVEGVHQPNKFGMRWRGLVLFGKNGIVGKGALQNGARGTVGGKIRV